MTSPAGAEPIPPFDVCGTLPTGTTVLEASAGTGKTFTIAALAARFVAEGVAELDQLMMVTFGRTATNDLRMRVRERLVGVERKLAWTLGTPTGRVAGHGPAPEDANLLKSQNLDAVEQLLCTGDAETLALRHGRIVRALSDFDAATIATTHEFCLHMLDGLGVLGNREPNAVFVEHLSELTREVAGDVYLRRYAARDELPALTFEEALRLAGEVVEASSIRLVPSTGPDGSSVAAERVAFAHEVRQEVQRRKKLGRLFSYDDMLTRLRDSLADPRYGEAAAERLRRRYQVVLVDEFQDTDPVQWEILRRAFHSAATMVLIGDPKQAIYAFRGADVYSYLDAVGAADLVATLSTNWRSDQALVEAVQTVMGGAALGDPRIVVRPVTAAQVGRRLSLAGQSSDDPTATGLTAPVRLRIEQPDPALERLPSVHSLRPQILADLVADVTSVLSSGLHLELDGVRRCVGPADIAVLVRKNERGEAIRDALVAAGVPAVLLGASSVFAAEMANQWLTLLVALEQPRQSLVRQASLTCFLGWSFGRLAGADEDALSALSLRVRWWSRTLATSGVAALLEAITTDTGLPERLLGEVGGERRLTDLRHIGQRLHAAMVAGQLGVSALLEWLREQVVEARAASMSEGTRRLETDAASVHILTVHRSKGLEFPIVYLPEAWDRHVSSDDSGASLRLHHIDDERRSDRPGPAQPEAGDPGGRYERVLDVGGTSGPGRVERWAASRREDGGEELRLLYVALTRAQCQLVSWWAPSRNTEASALHRLLHGPRRVGVEPDPRYPATADPFSASHLKQGFSLELMDQRLPRVWQPRDPGRPELRTENFGRHLDLAWRRTSYSALTAAVHGRDLTTAAVGSEPEPAKEDDESYVAAATAAAADQEATVVPGLDRPSPMAELPSGAAFGTAVHSIVESVDPRSDDLLGALHAAATTELSRSPSGPMTAEALALGLHPVFLTPLGPLAGQRRLCDIDSADRLAELTFELPLAGGDSVRGEVLLGALAPLLRRHLRPDDPLVGYADLVAHPSLAEQTLRGYLNGSIDAVLRLRDADGAPRYLVVDYKTNWLGDFNGEVLTLASYAPEHLADAMVSAHYPLQALLYSVAVHRMLRWRQPGYDPASHLGGVLYLFVRGMAGPDTPVVAEVPCGVFSWLPPSELVVELSDLLENGGDGAGLATSTP